MQLDSKGRTLPWESYKKVEPKRDRFIFTAADYKWFEILSRHLYAPSNYLLAAQLPLRRNRGLSLERLKDFCRGSKEQGKILVAPPQQFSQRYAQARHKVYRNTQVAHGLLGDRAEEVAPSTSASFVHDLMQACVGISLELTAPNHGLRYVSRSRILRHKYSGTARTSESPMVMPGGLRLDDVFALEDPKRLDKRGETLKRIFLEEIDRNTESMDPRGKPLAGATYFGQKLEAIDRAITNGKVMEWIGVHSPRVLIVTTTGTRAKQILERVRRLKNAARFYITVVPEFADDPAEDLFWRVPDHILTHLLDEPWLTVDGPKRITE